MHDLQPGSAVASESHAIARDFQNVVTDAQELLKTMGDEGGAGLAELKRRAQGSIDLARRRVVELQAGVVDSAKEAATNADGYVRANAWTAIGIGAGLGAVVGFIVARR